MTAASVLLDGIPLAFAMCIATPTPLAIARVCARIREVAFAKQAVWDSAVKPAPRNTTLLASVREDVAEVIVFVEDVTKRAFASAIWAGLGQLARCHVQDALRRVPLVVMMAEKETEHVFVKRAMMVKPVHKQPSFTQQSGVFVMGLAVVPRVSGLDSSVATIRCLEQSWRMAPVQVISHLKVRPVSLLSAVAWSHRRSTTAIMNSHCRDAHTFRTAKSATQFVPLVTLEQEATNVSLPGMFSGQFAC